MAVLTASDTWHIGSPEFHEHDRLGAVASLSPLARSFACWIAARTTALFRLRLEAMGRDCAAGSGGGLAEMGVPRKSASLDGSASVARGIQVNRARRAIEPAPAEEIAEPLPAHGWEDAEGEEKEIDRRAFGAHPREQILALYDEYRPRLYRYIRSLGIHRDLVEEIIQETFLRLTAQLIAEKEIENLQGWIVRVAHNLAADRRKENEREVPTAADARKTEQRVDPAKNPEQAYLEKEQMLRMNSALETLSAKQRHCFLMRAEGFRYKDIGLALGISEPRAHLLVKQAAAKLTEICG